jgi:hypothetical protein
VYDGPRYVKPSHQYGAPLPDDPDWNSPEDAVYDDKPAVEPDWAGLGFEKPSTEPEA